MLPHPDEYIPTMSQGGYSFHAGNINFTFYILDFSIKIILM